MEPKTRFIGTAALFKSRSPQDSKARSDWSLRRSTPPNLPGGKDNEITAAPKKQRRLGRRGARSAERGRKKTDAREGAFLALSPSTAMLQCTEFCTAEASSAGPGEVEGRGHFWCGLGLGLVLIVLFQVFFYWCL